MLHEHAWVPDERGSLRCRCDAWMPRPLGGLPHVTETVDGEVVPLRPPRRRKPAGTGGPTRRRSQGGAA